VALTLSPGSVFVEVTVILPNGASASAIRSLLSPSASFIEYLLSKLRSVPAALAVATGDISVGYTAAPVVEESPTTFKISIIVPVSTTAAELQRKRAMRPPTLTPQLSDAAFSVPGIDAVFALNETIRVINVTTALAYAEQIEQTLAPTPAPTEEVVANATVNFTEENVTEEPPNVTEEPPAQLVWYTQPAPFQATYGNVDWLLEVDVSLLPAGRRYRLCTDLDGESPGKVVGDTGLTAYVSPVISVSPKRLVPSATSLLRLLCKPAQQRGVPGGSCGGIAAAFLATECNGPIPPPAYSESVLPLQDLPNVSERSNDDSNVTCPATSSSVASATPEVAVDAASRAGAAETAETGQSDASGDEPDPVLELSFDTRCLRPGLYRICLIGGPVPPDQASVDAVGSVGALRATGAAVPSEDSGLSLELLPRLDESRR